MFGLVTPEVKAIRSQNLFRSSSLPAWRALREISLLFLGLTRWEASFANESREAQLRPYMMGA